MHDYSLIPPSNGQVPFSVDQTGGQDNGPCYIAQGTALFCASFTAPADGTYTFLVETYNSECYAVIPGVGDPDNWQSWWWDQYNRNGTWETHTLKMAAGDTLDIYSNWGVDASAYTKLCVAFAAGSLAIDFTAVPPIDYWSAVPFIASAVEGPGLTPCLKSGTIANNYGCSDGVFTFTKPGILVVTYKYLAAKADDYYFWAERLGGSYSRFHAGVVRAFIAGGTPSLSHSRMTDHVHCKVRVSSVHNPRCTSQSWRAASVVPSAGLKVRHSSLGAVPGSDRRRITAGEMKTTRWHRRATKRHLATPH